VLASVTSVTQPARRQRKPAGARRPISERTTVQVALPSR
jgi:hypothetical protein